MDGNVWRSAYLIFNPVLTYAPERHLTTGRRLSKSANLMTTAAAAVWGYAGQQPMF